MLAWGSLAEREVVVANKGQYPRGDEPVLYILYLGRINDTILGVVGYYGLARCCH